MISVDRTPLISINRDEIAAWAGLIILVLGAIASFVKWVYPPLKKMSQMAHDFVGHDARPGIPRQPGVMERLEDVEALARDAAYNSKPNGGNSAYDHLVKQNAADKEEIKSDIAGIIEVVATHIRESEADRSGLHREVNLLKIDRSEHHNDQPNN